MRFNFEPQTCFNPHLCRHRSGSRCGRIERPLSFLSPRTILPRLKRPRTLLTTVKNVRGVVKNVPPPILRLKKLYRISSSDLYMESLCDYCTLLIRVFFFHFSISLYFFASDSFDCCHIKCMIFNELIFILFLIIFIMTKMKLN
jgi:hypothetical protein